MNAHAEIFPSMTDRWVTQDPTRKVEILDWDGFPLGEFDSVDAYRAAHPTGGRRDYFTHIRDNVYQIEWETT